MKRLHQAEPRDESADLQQELMEELRAVKIQQLLAGEADDSGDSGDDTATSSAAATAAAAAATAVGTSIVGGADIWMSHDDPEFAECSVSAPLPGEQEGHDGTTRGHDGSRPSSSKDVRPSSVGDVRPSSSKDVTPTPTPEASQALQVNVSGGGLRWQQPRPPDKLSPGYAAEGTGLSPKRGLLHSRMSGGQGDAPPVLRHLRMPEEPRLADAAAEILQLN